MLKYKVLAAMALPARHGRGGRSSHWSLLTGRGVVGGKARRSGSLGGSEVVSICGNVSQRKPERDLWLSRPSCASPPSPWPARQDDLTRHRAARRADYLSRQDHRCGYNVLTGADYAPVVKLPPLPNPPKESHQHDAKLVPFRVDLAYKARGARERKLC